MCRTYNTIGSLTTLKSNLEQNNIHDFKSLNELITFQKSYSTLRLQLISHHESLIEQEKNNLNVDLPILYKEVELQRQRAVEILTEQIDNLKHQLQKLNNNTSTNFLQKLVTDLKYWNYKRKIKRKEYCFEKDVERSIVKILDEYNFKKAIHGKYAVVFLKMIGISLYLIVSMKQ